MDIQRALILPGMDGTGDLSEGFAAALSPLNPEIVRYSQTDLLGYEELEVQVRELLSAADSPTLIIGESFSGLLAIRIGANPPPNLRAVVLVATFARPPLPRPVRHIAKPWFFRGEPPAWLTRWQLLGGHEDDALLDQVREVTRRISPEVMSHRAQEILTTDVESQLRELKLPCLFIQGSRDRLVKTRKERLKSLCPQLEWQQFDAPHLVLQTMPAETADAVKTFAMRH